MNKEISKMVLIIMGLVLISLPAVSFAQGPGSGGGYGCNGRFHDEDWPDSLAVINVSGVVTVDSTMINPAFYLESNADDSLDYRLGFGPWWYQPASGAIRPESGDSVYITGGLNDSMIPAMLVVFEIDGLVWRDSTGAPPWSGGWVHGNSSDTTWIQCPTDSSDHLGFPPQSMGGMMWPDSIYCQFEELHPDSMPGNPDDSIFEGYLCRFNTTWGGGMGSGHMNFNRQLRFRFHYNENLAGRSALDENSIQPVFLDENNIWQDLTDYVLDTSDNSVYLSTSQAAEYFALKTTSTTATDGRNNALPVEVKIESIYPNPFNPQVTIEYQIDNSSFVSANIFDLRGNLVKELHSGFLDAGTHSMSWNSSDDSGKQVSTGTYLVKVKAGNYQTIEKLTLVK